MLWGTVYVSFHERCHVLTLYKMMLKSLFPAPPPHPPHLRFLLAEYCGASFPDSVCLFFLLPPDHVTGTVTTQQVCTGRSAWVPMTLLHLLDPAALHSEADQSIVSEAAEGSSSFKRSARLFIALREQHLTGKEQRKHHGTGTVR